MYVFQPSFPNGLFGKYAMYSAGVAWESVMFKAFMLLFAVDNIDLC
jgi:hypothetical protein